MERSGAEPTRAQLEYGLRAIRIAIAGSIAAIAAMIVVFVGFLDVPAVPVVPIAVLVIIADLGFLAFFTARRREEIRRAELRESGADPGGRSEPAG